MAQYKGFGQTTLLYEAIVNEIEQRVVTHQLKPGDSLPPERELARLFGVSRTAVREAIKVLSQKQLIAVLPGKGAVVVHPSPAVVTASLGLLFKLGRATPAQVAEVRMGLEPEMAARAALRASPEQARAIEEIAASFRASREDPQKATALDISFHRSVSAAAQNEVARAVLDSIQELYRESMLPGYKVDGAPERAVYYHSQIARAIAERDAEAARRFMREHLDHVWRDLTLLEEQRSEEREHELEPESPEAGPKARRPQGKGLRE